HERVPLLDDILASAPVEGGPKTAFEAEDTVTSAQLLQEVDICTDLSVEQRQKLTDVIMTNANAFGLDKRLGDYEGLVDIPLKPGTKPISLPPFAASPANRKVIDEQMDTWLKQEVIEPSRSPWATPVFIAYRNNK
ncbi:hypothetical protein FISHEDRAFT_10773, partial [Fistulina hepatica ATCC 64428]